jgi:UDP-N-acetylmuramate dehydrogenase
MKKQKFKEIFSGGLFEGEVTFGEPMSDHTSLRIGGPADIFAVPRTLVSLMNMHSHFNRKRIPCFPLGGGTNVLIGDGGIEGAVISLRSFRRIGVLSRDSTCVYLNVEAGTLLQGLVRYTKENGYSGIEGLAGIPGTVGGAICGNAGAFGCEMKDVLVSVGIMDAGGKTKKIAAEEITFGYRSSGIMTGELILDADIKLRVDTREAVAARIDGFLREKRKKQPLWEHSAGCVFKNPPGLSAGKLIDETGCKGMKIGDVEVSTLHANFFVNRGRALAADFFALMNEVARRVRERFGVTLEPEIRIVGRNGNG